MLTIGEMVVDPISDEVASLKLTVAGHVELMIDREAIYTHLRATTGQPY